MTMGSKANYDLIIFGASGYTGQYVIEYVYRAVELDLKNQLGDKKVKLKWAVAGRSMDKLAKVLMAAHLSNPGFDHGSIDMIFCDASDESSINDMAAQTKILLNCVGPFRFSGEKVVKACVAQGTHHVDISGEPQFLETMQLKYNDEAEKKGIYIVGSCGFDSIPSDLGQTVVHQSMNGPVNTIETFLKCTTPPDESGAVINFATWQSAIYGFSMAHELKSVRRAMFPDRLPKLKPALEKRSALHWNPLVKSWCMDFPGSDRSVMNRTQRARYHRENKRPVQIMCFAQFSSLFSALMMMLIGMFFGFLAMYKAGRWLLEKYPAFFSMGMVSKQGPTRRMAENTNFEMTLYGRGWKGEDEGSLTDFGTETTEVTVTVKGRNIGYGATCEMLVQSAITILKESDKIPGSGGVLTPGFAFKDTSLIRRLNENGVTFDVTVNNINSIAKS
jgi:short subunit dehydrogenase-like uncharacterized protein